MSFRAANCFRAASRSRPRRVRRSVATSARAAPRSAARRRAPGPSRAGAPRRPAAAPGVVVGDVIAEHRPAAARAPRAPAGRVVAARAPQALAVAGAAARAPQAWRSRRGGTRSLRPGGRGAAARALRRRPVAAAQQRAPEASAAAARQEPEVGRAGAFRRAVPPSSFLPTRPPCCALIKKNNLQGGKQSSLVTPKKRNTQVTDTAQPQGRGPRGAAFCRKPKPFLLRPANPILPGLSGSRFGCSTPSVTFRRIVADGDACRHIRWATRWSLLQQRRRIGP